MKSEIGNTMSKIHSTSGFAITGAMLAWALGLSALLGGGAYVTNEAMSDNDYSWQGRGGADNSFVPDQSRIAAIPIGNLSEVEKDGLVRMREEEKLARDVYRTLFDMWGVQVFQNISYSENRHTLAVKELLDRYSIQDPVSDDSTGVFTIPQMQALYNDLVAQGSTSLLDALKVGATIEDLDIYDLNKWIAENDNEDIAMVYGSLIRGSRNHMRSFNKQIGRNGGTYDAQYLTQMEVDAILNGSQEQGSHSKDNNSRGVGQRRGVHR